MAVLGFIRCCFVLFFVNVSCVFGEYGLLYARSGVNNSNDVTICVAYNSLYQKLPTDYASTKQRLLANYSSSIGCEDIYTTQIHNHVVFISRGNCTFAEKAEFVQEKGGAAVVVVQLQNQSSLIVPGGSKEDYKNISIIVATILASDFQSLNTLGDTVYISLYAPEASRVDPNMACIFLIAMFCVGVGSYWSGIIRHQGKSGRSGGKEAEEDESVQFSPLTIIILVVLLCGMLVSLYYFYDYLVYFIIGLFTLAGSVGLFFCLQPFWYRIIFCRAHIPVDKNRCCSGAIEIRDIVLYLLCAGFSIFWAVQRNESYAWILQDILGAAFSINMLKTIRLPSLKMCTILLVLLFFYDIFFVFITPLFTSSGKSIMVDVATGGNSSTGEQLPMVFKFPRLLSSALSMCFNHQAFSLLGFGDVLVPGLLISYNHGFDIEVDSGRVYFIASLIAYAVGLGLTYLALAFMETGQPALLYIVPCVLITTFVIACRRRQFRHLWSGKKNSKKDDSIRNEDYIVQGDKTQPPNTASINRSASSSTISVDANEERVLIK